MALSVSYSVMVDLGCTLPDCRDSLAPASTERGISPNRGANYMAAYLSPNQRTQFTLLSTPNFPITPVYPQSRLPHFLTIV